MVVAKHACERFLQRVLGYNAAEISQQKIDWTRKMILSELEYLSYHISVLKNGSFTLENFTDFQAVIKGCKIITIKES